MKVPSSTIRSRLEGFEYALTPHSVNDFDSTMIEEVSFLLFREVFVPLILRRYQI